MRRVCQERLRMESDGRWCPAHRHRPEQPTPQGFGAVAAIERDDRATISVRVPRCLPDGRGNKTRRTVQPAVAFRTHRALALAATVGTVHSLLPRTGSTVTCSRTAERRRTCSRSAVRFRDMPGARATAGRIDESARKMLGAQIETNV